MSEIPGGPGQPDEPPDYLSTSVITDLSAERRGGSRSWLPWLVAVDTVVVILVITGIVGVKAGWFSNDSDSADGSAVTTRLAEVVPSTPKALTAAVLAHIPPDVTIVWSNGNGDLDKVMPGSPSSLAGALITSILLEKDSHQFYLSIITSPAPPGGGPAYLAYPKQDAQGRVVSETVVASTDTSSAFLMEIAGPGGAGLLPLSEADLHTIVTDPLVSPTTTRQMLERSATLPSWDPHGLITWPHSPI